jgi:hypothetical protein
MDAGPESVTLVKLIQLFRQKIFNTTLNSQIEWLFDVA